MTHETNESPEFAGAEHQSDHEAQPAEAVAAPPAAQSSPVTGAVADIEDRYTLIINKGENAGVKPGMIFAVLGDEGNHVIDPITGEDLGPRPGVKLRVKVTDVFEKFSRAETYVIVSPFERFGLGGPRSGISPTMQEMLEARELRLAGGGRQRLAGYGRPKEDEDPAPEAVVTVRIGDRVKQVG